MKRVLIVNADDYNLTPGVTAAILECHDRGIVSSTTFLVNLPVAEKTIKQIKKHSRLGVGIHLNITLAKPVSSLSNIRSLVGADGNFRKVKDQRQRLPKPAEVAVEYQNQILRFQQIFGRRPTHLDTHHQIHDHPHFFRVLTEAARRNRLPVRRSSLMRGAAARDERTTDYLFGNLSPEGYWRPGPLEAILENLPEGVSEIMCHPGKNDSALGAISSFTAGRAAELRLFRSPALRGFLRSRGILLSHFGLCYT